MRVRFSLTGAAFLCAAFVMSLAFSWFLVAQVQAQALTDIEGQLVNGTRDAPAENLANVPVTLFQITAAGPITRTLPTDTGGKFQFTDVIPDASAYFTRVDYAGIRYFSDIRPAEFVATNPITLTVYETQTLPVNFTLDRMHLVLDVQPGRFNGLQLLQLTNPGDRAFYLPLPIPEDARDVQFQDIREQTIVTREPDGTILYPVLPTTTDILYGVLLPFTPPDYRLDIPLKTGASALSLLISRMSDVRVNADNLSPSPPFTAQSGQEYLVFSAPAQRAGTLFSATISNLPGADNTGTLQTIILVGGGLGALALLAYPVYQSRLAKNRNAAPSERVARLQAMARLDDEFAAGALEANEYYAERAELKAELLKAEVEAAKAEPEA